MRIYNQDKIWPTCEDHLKTIEFFKNTKNSIFMIQLIIENYVIYFFSMTNNSLLKYIPLYLFTIC